MSGDFHQEHGQTMLRTLFYIVIFFLYLIPLITVFSYGFDDFFELFRRITGLMGIISLFVAIILSSLVKQSKQIFGVAYLKVHHFFSIMGLVLITLHPIIMAIDFGTTGIFIPNFSSWNAFLTNGGRLAIYLIYIATLSAILRRNIAKYWRYFHALLYPAFLLGAIHAMFQGSDLRSISLYTLFVIMIALVIVNFICKRYQLNFKK
jgi:methionine sulfoxide reductase heme-binding subunit